MNKEEKKQMVEQITEHLASNNVLYLADMSAMTVEQSNNLRRLAFKRNVLVKVVKNSLLKKAMEKSEKEFDALYGVLKGNTAMMISDTGNVPAKLIKDFRKKTTKPQLKAALIDDGVYLGDNQLETLVNLKSKNELIGDIILLLQSPAKNVVSALQSGGQNLTGILKTLSEKN